jgi:alkylation response protein AidB-like acyl-CoA dehydrogenase
MAARVIDRAIQIHGGAGVSQDTFLAEAYTYAPLHAARRRPGPGAPGAARTGIAEEVWNGVNGERN